jgi:hypothetical protein
MTNLQLHGVFYSSSCKNYNIEKITTQFITWACRKGPKITTCLILQHELLKCKNC